MKIWTDVIDIPKLTFKQMRREIRKSTNNFMFVSVSCLREVVNVEYPDSLFFYGERSWEEVVNNKYQKKWVKEIIFSPFSACVKSIWL